MLDNVQNCNSCVEFTCRCMGYSFTLKMETVRPLAFSVSVGRNAGRHVSLESAVHAALDDLGICSPCPAAVPMWRSWSWVSTPARKASLLRDLALSVSRGRSKAVTVCAAYSAPLVVC
jgi:hypothetical protein